MKKMKSQAVGLGLLVAMILANSGSTYAGDSARPTKCTLDTLKEQYLFSATGSLFPPAFDVTAPSVSAVAGYFIYNGDGTGTDFVTFTVNGINQNVTSNASTRYTLGSDCTGTKTVLPYRPHFDIFVGLDGDGLTAVATDPGFAVTESDRRSAR